MAGYGQNYDDLRVHIADDKLGIALVLLPALAGWIQLVVIIVAHLFLGISATLVGFLWAGAFLIGMAILASRDAPRWRMESGSSFLFILLLFVVGYPFHMASRAKRGAPLGLGAGLCALALMFLPIMLVPLGAGLLSSKLHATNDNVPAMPAPTVAPIASALSPKAAAAAAELAAENTDQAVCNAHECTVGILGDSARATLAEPANAGKVVHMENPTQERFATLASYPGITKLRIHAAHRQAGKALVKDLTPLAALSQLEELELWETGNTDLKALAPLTRLEKLTLANTMELASLDGLESLVNLKSVDFSVKGIHDLSHLGALSNLQEAKLAFGSKVDLAPFAKLGSLRSLELTYFDHVSLAPLGALEALRTLKLTGTTGMTDWAALGKLTGLESLDVWGPVADLSFVTPMAHLTHAGFIANKVLVNVAPLGKLPGLTSLDFTEVGLADVAPLAGCTHLRGMSLRETKVKDVAPLVSLKELASLKLSGDPGIDLMPLAKMTGLKMLTVSAKEIPDVQIQAFKAAAPKVRVALSS